MRSFWSGAVSFGLINIPVKLYTATDDHGLDFTMLHKGDLSPIRYARICKAEGKEIPFEDIVKGYEYQKGDYVVLTDEDFVRANVRKNKAIDIVGFAEETEIDSVYFEKPYYLEPDQGAEKAYFLLREALKQSKKVGIAHFVLKAREHLAILKPQDNVVVLNQLRYHDEVRATKDLNLPEVQPIEKRELDMAIALIEQLTKVYKPADYQDTYRKELEEVIAQKSKGKPVKPKGEEPQATDVKDLMDVLKASLEAERAKAGSQS